MRGSINKVTRTACTVYRAQIVWTGPISCIRYFATASIEEKQNIAPIIKEIERDELLSEKTVPLIYNLSQGK
tara:strand:+ start:137 stop:352 length:216 start_codon:yes stop_codon:yes gene_type:complete